MALDPKDPRAILRDERRRRQQSARDRNTPMKLHEMRATASREEDEIVKAAIASCGRADKIAIEMGERQRYRAKQPRGAITVRR